MPTGPFSDGASLLQEVVHALQDPVSVPITEGSESRNQRKQYLPIF